MSHGGYNEAAPQREKAVELREQARLARRDGRATDADLLEAIDAKGREVDEALARLRALIGTAQPAGADTPREGDPAHHQPPNR